MQEGSSTLPRRGNYNRSLGRLAQLELRGNNGDIPHDALKLAEGRKDYMCTLQGQVQGQA